MKKFYLFLIVFILQVSIGFAESLSDFYPAQTLGVWCFDAKWASKLLGYTGKDNEFAKAYQEVVTCLKERISIDIDKAFGKTGVFLVPSGGSFSAVGVFSGNFDIKKINSLVEEALAKTNNKNVKIENVKINGKSVKSLNDGVQTVIFYSDSAIIYCPNTSLEELKNNRITFTKAPEEVSKMLNEADTFIYFSKAAVPLLGMLRVPPQFIEGVTSLTSYVDNDNNLKTKIGFSDPNTARQVVDGLKNLVTMFNGYYAGDFEKNKRSLKENPVGDMSETIISMYSLAKAKDFIDSLDFSTENANVVISAKFDAFKILGGVIGGIMNVAMKSPHFANARSEARKKGCFANQRVLMGAIEMYNMDHSTMMTTLDIPTLVKDGYLKSAPIGTEPDCNYTVVGDITNDGYISCSRHGSPADQQ